MLSKVASSTIFWVFGMTQPRIEPCRIPDHYRVSSARIQATQIYVLVSSCANTSWWSSKGQEHLPRDFHFHNLYKVLKRKKGNSRFWVLKKCKAHFSEFKTRTLHEIIATTTFLRCLGRTQQFSVLSLTCNVNGLNLTL